MSSSEHNVAPPAPVDLDVEHAVKQAKANALEKSLNESAWSEASESLLQKWGEKAAGLKWMHNQDSRKFKAMAMKYSLPLVLMSTLAGVGGIGSASISSAGQVVALYTVGAINIASAMIVALQRLHNPDEKSANHADVAKQFGSYFREISLELALPRSDRSNPQTLTKWAKREFDRIMDEAPPISGETVSAFNSRFKSQKNKPDVAETVINIEIHD